MLMRSAVFSLVIAAGITLSVSRPAAAQPAAATNTCASCHAGLSDARLARPATTFAGQDVHRENGFLCADCHGGDRDGHGQGAGARSGPRIQG